MHKLSILLVVVLCSSCTLRNPDIQKTLLKPNQAVVFDIDGTLTPEKSAFFIARDDAARAVQLFADNGYKIIYLSARPELSELSELSELAKLAKFSTSEWLKANNFPEGSIQLSTLIDISKPAAFKKRILKEFQKKGWNFFAAYGDSSTDFEAYSEVGIDKDHVFALRPSGDDSSHSCQPGIWAECLNSWTDHMDQIMQMVQP